MFHNAPRLALLQTCLWEYLVLVPLSVYLYYTVYIDYDCRYDTERLANYHARVYHNGTVIWLPSTVYQVACSMDITYFPWDIHTCELIFGSWSLTDDELVLNVQDNKDVNPSQVRNINNLQNGCPGWGRDLGIGGYAHLFKVVRGAFLSKNNVGANLIKIRANIVWYTFYHVYNFQEDRYRTILSKMRFSWEVTKSVNMLIKSLITCINNQAKTSYFQDLLQIFHT